MAASNNVFALMDSLTGTIYAIVVDSATPPGVGSANNTYWNMAITTATGNPLVAVPMPIITYNAALFASLNGLFTTLFNTLGIAITL